MTAASTAPSDPADVALVHDVCRTLATETGDPAELAHRHVRARAPLLSPAQHDVIVRAVLAEITGLGVLEELLADPTVDEVLVNAGRDIWLERHGVLEPAGQLPPGRIDALVERILTPLGRRLDRSSPVVDARLPDGSRVCAVIAPVAVDGTCLCIRRFRVTPIPLEQFAPPPVVELLGDLVHARCNVVVSGATSAGKTTLLNALAGLVPAGERLVTLEDTSELRLAGEHVVRLEARPSAPDGPPPVELQHLLRAALRLRPDRLVVGEVRGAEALDLLQALNTGHDGSLATVHANGTRDTVRRLTTLVLQGTAMPVAAVEGLVHAAVDAVVHVERSSGGRRTITAIAELPQPGQRHPQLRPLVHHGEVVGALDRRRSR